MKTSDSLTKLAPSLLAAQQAITFAVKDAKNPHLKNTYADLESIINAVKNPLNDNGIVFLQTFSPSEPGTLRLVTRLLHTSGEWIEDELTMPLQKNDAQGYGSAATYSRRYALAAITGLYQADDDGTAAVQPAASKPMPKAVEKPAALLTTDQVTAIEDAAAECGIPVDEICKTGKVKSLAEIKAASYEKLMNWIYTSKDQA